MSLEALEINPIEAQANCEELPTEIFFRRLSHPKIREQIIKTLEETDIGVWGTVLSNQSDPGGWGPSYIDIGVFVDRLISKERERTLITLEKGATPRAHPLLGIAMVPVCWSLDDINSASHRAIAEAHEKGHVIRPYVTREIHRKFMSAIDEKSILYNLPGHENYPDKDEWLEVLWNNYEAVLDVLDYITSAPEIAERMSQLKNYFGMDGDQEFTKEHLDYAREHYVKDTGFDNNMTMFFSGITPETEDKFLEIINTCGI